MEMESHGKFETLGALGISGMLLLNSGGIACHAIDVLQSRTRPRAPEETTPCTSINSRPAMGNMIIRVDAPTVIMDSKPINSPEFWPNQDTRDASNNTFQHQP
ncbi:Metal tolerance protein 2 [Acorus calamus]|uniref:Metal tolerance protein 2 n=1 Tax=Acorus calamus TaxID=4465 RepID=A0AAV9CAS0_ACOCL|nr:Metal tolerance protein 2 [Acorus calamus]